MDAEHRATENALFYNIDSTSYATTSVPGYPNPNAADSVARLDVQVIIAQSY